MSQRQWHSGLPRGSKLLCINRKQGIALLSDWRDDFGFTHWHPLPRFTSSHP